MKKHVIAAAFALSAAPAFAQAADAVAAANTLVEIMNPAAAERAALNQQLAAVRRGDSLRAMFAGNPAFRQEAAKNQPKFNSGLARAGALLADAVGPIQTEMLAATRRELVQAYAKRFTAAELNAIIAFMRTPAGAKLVQQQGQVQAEAARAVQQRYAPRLQAAQQSVGPKVQAELNQLVPKQPGAK